MMFTPLHNYFLFIIIPPVMDVLVKLKRIACEKRVSSKKI